MASSNKLTPMQFNMLLSTLENRFIQHPKRHEQLVWAEVNNQLVKLSKGNAKQLSKLWSLHQMEATGGEPDVIAYNAKTKEYLFVDCATESPTGRRSLCYDRAALESRKEHRPADNVLDMAAAMGVELLDENAYKLLQEFGPFDTKTSSWIKTPKAVRHLGGALFADFRYGQVFVYHNGAASYYAARGFRAAISV